MWQEKAEARAQEVCAGNKICKCTQFEEKQNTYKSQKGIFKCEGRVLWETVTKPDQEINESCSQLKEPLKYMNPPPNQRCNCFVDHLPQSARHYSDVMFPRAHDVMRPTPTSCHETLLAPSVEKDQ